MIAVGAGVLEAEKYLASHEDLFVACHNSPESVTVAGKSDAIDQLGSDLTHAGIFNRKIMSSGNANHSPMVARAARYFNSAFKDSLPKRKAMSGRSARAPMYSCITGDVVSGENVGIEYWGRNIADPVLFNQAAQIMLTSESSIDHIVEIGPHSALAGPLKQIASALGFSTERLKYIPTLVRGSNGVDDMLRPAGTLFLRGYDVDLEQANSRGRISENGSAQQIGKHLVDLPTYQWNYDQLHWVESRLSCDLRFRKHQRHDYAWQSTPRKLPRYSTMAK